MSWTTMFFLFLCWWESLGIDSLLMNITGFFDEVWDIFDTGSALPTGSYILVTNLIGSSKTALILCCSYWLFISHLLLTTTFGRFTDSWPIMILSCLKRSCPGDKWKFLTFSYNSSLDCCSLAIVRVIWLCIWSSFIFLDIRSLTRF